MHPCLLAQYFVTFSLQPCSINPGFAKLFQVLKYLPLCFGKVQASPTNTFQILALFCLLLSLWLFISLFASHSVSSSNASHSQTLLSPSFQIVYIVVLHSEKGVASFFWLMVIHLVPHLTNFKMSVCLEELA